MDDLIEEAKRVDAFKPKKTLPKERRDSKQDSAISINFDDAQTRQRTASQVRKKRPPSILQVPASNPRDSGVSFGSNRSSVFDDSDSSSSDMQRGEATPSGSEHSEGIQRQGTLKT